MRHGCVPVSDVQKEPASADLPPRGVPLRPILVACSVLAFLTLTFAIVSHFARASLPQATTQP